MSLHLCGSIPVRHSGALRCWNLVKVDAYIEHVQIHQLLVGIIGTLDNIGQNYFRGIFPHSALRNHNN